MATWRNCTTNQVTQSPIPDGWMPVLNSGPEGGICWELPAITISPSAVSFEYDNYSSQYPASTVLTIRNTSDVSSYRVNMETHEVFTILPAQVTLNPLEEKTIEVSIPPTELLKFQIGTTEFRLQTNITKL